MPKEEKKEYNLLDPNSKPVTGNYESQNTTAKKQHTAKTDPNMLSGPKLFSATNAPVYVPPSANESNKMRVGGVMGLMGSKTPETTKTGMFGGSGVAATGTGVNLFGGPVSSDKSNN